MEFISPILEEIKICDNYNLKNRENSPKINYFNKVNDKPWGKEYLAFQNKYIGIWILHVNCDQETSLHCHFKKDTIVIPLSGCFKINLFNDKFKILHLFDSLYVPRNTFHGIHSYVENGILMEIEIYTDSIEYTDKNDLLRLKDIYNRDKNQYQTSVIERQPNENEIMDFSKSTNYHLNNNTKVDVMELNFVDDSLLNYDKVILLEGTICSDGKRITTGSFLDLKIPYSILTNKIKVICIKNINYKYTNKIIYSKNHLFDYLLLNKKYKYGLTSGCFDILHEGHINNLKLCKKNCEKLFVCLSSDNQIKRLKGDSRPVNSLNDRINMLIQFDFIDNIILYDEINDELETELDNLMNILNPSVWFKGNDYNKEEIFKKHPSLKSVILFELVEGKSTTNLINKINKNDKINEQNIKL